MSNKTRLQTNNNNLDVCIAKANSLPNAGGSGSIETCTVVQNYSDFSSSQYCVIYVNKDGEPVMEPLLNTTRSYTFTVQKNSLYYCSYGLYPISGNCTLIQDAMGDYFVALITDDVEFD